MRPAKTVAATHARRRLLLWIAAALIAVVFLAYRGVGDCGFVNLDDDAYVQHQPMVNQGFRPAAVAWAFSAAHSGMWHPLTTLSHIFDCTLFGVRAGPMHWENVAWHALNAVLVFAALHLLTGARWRSAAVAALFALHPLGVESVAWISERKNLLSTAFLLLTLCAYARFTRTRSRIDYAAVVAAMVLSLLAKPMAVTLPALLLVLDYWPLGRGPQVGWRRLVLEKLPLLALSVAHSAITLGSQRSVGADDFGATLSLGARAANALISYARYLGKALWPDALSVFYAHPGSWPAISVLGAAALLILISWLAWHSRDRRPWILAGWLWFLGTLVPVIGLVQVGTQAMADRYTYVPLLGFYVAVVWTAAAALAKTRRARAILGTALAIVLAACFVLTGRQVSAWATSARLYERSIAAGGDNATLRYLLAMAHAAEGKPTQVIVDEFQRALVLDPHYANALTQLAFIDFGRGRFEAAEAALRKVIALSPRRAAAHMSLGAFFMHRGRPAEAEAELRAALNLDPGHVPSHMAMATLLLGRQQTQEAHAHLLAAVRADPWNPEAHCELGIVCAVLQRLDDARVHLARALWIRPTFPRAAENLALLAELERKARAGKT